MNRHRNSTLRVLGWGVATWGDGDFAAGSRLVWEIDPRARTAAVYNRPDAADALLSAPAVLDGGSALPGFAVPLADRFAELDRRR